MFWHGLVKKRRKLILEALPSLPQTTSWKKLLKWMELTMSSESDAANAVTSGKYDTGKALFCATVHEFGEWTSRNR